MQIKFFKLLVGTCNSFGACIYFYFFSVPRPKRLIYQKYSKTFRQTSFPSDCSLSIIDREMQVKQDAANFDKLLEVQVELSNTIFRWEVPMVCRWEPWEESKAFKELDPVVQYFNLHYDEIMQQKLSLLFNSSAKQLNNAEMVHDFDLFHIPEHIKLFYLITRHILPRLTSTYKFPCELQDEQDKLAAEIKRRHQLQLEHEEDLKMIKEKKLAEKIVRRRQRELRKLQRDEAALLAAQYEDTKESDPDQESEMNAIDTNGDTNIDEHSESSETDSDEAEDQDVDTVVQTNTNNTEPALKFKKLVQGPAAKELFVYLDKYPTLDVI